MPNLLAEAAAMVSANRHEHLTSEVSFERGGEAVTVQATVGETVFRLDNGAGGTIRYVSRDYLVRSQDLVIGGVVVEPRRGDRIVHAIGGDHKRHEVLGPGGDEPDWRYSDPSHLTIRLHTREVG